MRRLLVLLLAGMLTLTACSSGGSDEGEISASPSVQTLPTDVTDALAAQLTKTMSSNDVPGAAVQVCVPGYENATIVQGVSNIETGTPMTGELVWPLRSVTKSYTVTLILQLVDEGKISLDDTIDQWVPGIPNGDSITLGQLADMTSGVPDYTGDAFAEDFAEDPGATFTRDQLIEYVREGEPSSAPGEDRHYINSSTILLGEVIEQVEGAGFDEVLATRILEPLALGGTAYPTDPEGFTADHPTGYQPDDDGLTVPPTNFTVFDTAGAMTSDVYDLMVWGEALSDGDLLDAQTHADRLVGSPLTAGPDYDTYATGIGEIDGWWGHTGEGFGYTTLVMHQPRSGATVVILMNVSNLDRHVPTVLFREFAEILAQ